VSVRVCVPGHKHHHDGSPFQIVSTVTKDGSLKYPMVRCRNHKAEPGYAVCTHLVFGLTTTVGAYRAPNPTCLGVIVCEGDDAAHHEPGGMTLICAQCAAEAGWVQPNKPPVIIRSANGESPNPSPEAERSGNTK